MLDRENPRSRAIADRAAQEKGWAFHEWKPGDRVKFTASGSKHDSRKTVGAVVDCRRWLGGNTVHIEDDGVVVKISGDRVRPDKE